jgi:hypothetical protein
MLSSLGRRRKQAAFLIVAVATFFCLSLIWPLSTKSWRSESEISLSLTKRKDSAVEFKTLLNQVVERHTSLESITRTLDQNGMGIDAQEITTAEIAEKVRQRLKIVLLDKNLDPDHMRVRVALDGAATEKENYFVNMMATTIAKDFMISPLAGIIPTDPVPSADIEALQLRHAEIEARANELLAQIETNLRDAATEMADATPGSLASEMVDSSSNRDEIADRLADLKSQRDRIANASGNSILELSAIDQQIEEVQLELENSDSDESKGPFHMASHTLNRVAVGESLTFELRSLHDTIGDLANVAAEACTYAETATYARPAFAIESVRGRPAVPVGAIPRVRELFYLLLASTLFATIVSISYQPFASRGFESVDQIGEKLKLPIIATLESRNEFEDVTGPGIPAESIKEEAPGSNQVVSFCKWILFCSLMLTIGFCLVNADIREAFFVSPFHGFAEIAWTLKGN